MSSYHEMIKASVTIPEVWDAMDLPGMPMASCCSPFRHDAKPSFSIYGEGRRWKDHGTGEGGDVIDFVTAAFNGEKSASYHWLTLFVRAGVAVKAPRLTREPSRPQTPGARKLLDIDPAIGTYSEWMALADARGLSLLGVAMAIADGILGFTDWGARRCFVVTDNERRAAEIRALDGGTFSSGTGIESKLAPLPGVDKTWLPGAARLRHVDPEASVLVCEGATDLLTARDLFTRYHEGGGRRTWVPVAVLGASCRVLDPECAELIRGRRVRLAFDADDAGAAATAHWGRVFCDLGCAVDRLVLPPGHDLGEFAPQLNPEDLFDHEG